MTSPWGKVQSVVDVAEGIEFVSTSSHGGYKLSEERLAALPERFKGLNKFGGGRFFEEDCEWAIVALAFPEAFSSEAANAARLTAERVYPQIATEVK